MDNLNLNKHISGQFNAHRNDAAAEYGGRWTG